LQRGVFDDLFACFGEGVHEDPNELYLTVRNKLPTESANFWDRKIGYFSRRSLKRSFYFHGASGEAAWLLKKIMLTFKRTVRRRLEEFLNAESLDRQRELYEEMEPQLWDALLCWVVRQPAMMALMGVPRPQIRLIEQGYPGGLLGYIQDKFRHVMTRIHIGDNYFWRVYATGTYTPTCCPNYLRPESFPLLRSNASRLHTYNCTVTEFLQEHPGEYTHFVLLDHQDWLAGHDPHALREEWDEIFANAAPGAKVLMRSAGITHDFLPEEVLERLRFDTGRTEQLHPTDRVGTYGSLHFAEIA
ncbi:MAG: DUF3419 family protein, partial [Phycisphaerae bacterium]